MMKRFLDTYDFNLPLLDALNDPEMSTTRRLLAGAAMPQGLDSAHYMTMEMFEAFERLAEDRRKGIVDGQGTAEVKEILEADSDDYQRRIYYIVSELDVYEALGELAWLVQVTRMRARMYPAIREAGAVMPPIPGAMRDAGDGGAWSSER